MTRSLHIVDFVCPTCAERQRRVVLDRMNKTTTCLHCKGELRWGDGTLRPGLAKCGVEA
jgi:predicted RNA-binding Zn-ribbon protein involved in translation (DUF1610 family)